MILCRLIYQSHRNTQAPLDIYDLMRISQKNNAQIEVTGFLFFDGRNFVQALEGRRESISHLYKRIVNDRRHQDVTLMSCTEIKDRKFSQWSMGLQEGLDQSTRDELLRIFSLSEIDLADLTSDQMLIFLEKVAKITERFSELESMMSLKS
jgi:hypothetical protein